jgi:hypothetical protein
VVDIALMRAERRRESDPRDYCQRGSSIHLRTRDHACTVEIFSGRVSKFSLSLPATAETTIPRDQRVGRAIVLELGCGGTL